MKNFKMDSDGPRHIHECKDCEPKLATETVMLQKSDFNSYAINDIEIWKALTNGDPTVETVEVRVIGVEKGEGR